MIKVICIDASIGVVSKEMPPFKEGDVLTVELCDVFPDSYLVTEYPLARNGMFQTWYKKRFIPLSNIDEMELLKERYGVEAENNFV